MNDKKDKSTYGATCWHRYKKMNITEYKRGAGCWGLLISVNLIIWGNETIKAIGIIGAIISVLYIMSTFVVKRK